MRWSPHLGVSALLGGHGGKNTIYEPWFSSDTDPPNTMTWDFQPLSCEQWFLLFIRHSVCGILSEQHKWTETPGDLLNCSDPPRAVARGFCWPRVGTGGAFSLSSPSGVPVLQSKTLGSCECLKGES